MTKKKALLLIVFLMCAIFVGLVASGKLVFFDVCSAKAAKVIPETEATKMLPATKEEQEYFGLKIVSKNSWPSVFSHEFMRCQMHGEWLPYFK